MSNRKLEEVVNIDVTQPQIATVLLIDTSGSMANEINNLIEGLTEFKNTISKDVLASKRVDLAIVTFGESVKVIHNFSNIEHFQVPQLVAEGLTPMGDAILKGIEILEERKKLYKANGVDYYRPWMLVLTDGEPTDMEIGDAKWNQVKDAIQNGINNKKFLFFPIAVIQEAVEPLKKLAPTSMPPALLKKGHIKEFFKWLTNSQLSVSTSTPGDQIKIETPQQAGWGEIPV